MKIDIKDYIVENKKSKKAALADMGLSLEDTFYVGSNRSTGWFPGDNDNAIDGEPIANEDYDDIADCGDEWYMD